MCSPHGASPVCRVFSDAWVNRDQLLYEHDLLPKPPRVSLFRVIGSLFADLVLLRWLYAGHKLPLDDNTRPLQSPRSVGQTGARRNFHGNQLSADHARDVT